MSRQRWWQWMRTGITAHVAVFAIGCGVNGRAVDESRTALTEATHTDSTRAFDPKERINTLSYGVEQADFVGHVVVSRVEGRVGTQGRAARPAIWSKVEFKVLYAVKDQGVSSEARFALDFLGGRVGPKEMHVDHVPRFEEGDELILIARSDEWPCPSFAGEYGVLRVADGQVQTYAGHSLRDINARGYVVATPATRMPTAPAPKPLGNASGYVVGPTPADQTLDLDVGNALARLSALARR